jgi:hypothetical protein
MNPTKCCGISVLAIAATALWIYGCALSVAPTGSEDRELTMELAAFPDQLSVRDSTATAEVWATLRLGNEPVRDSTLVFFAVTAGAITPSSYTKDGLAVAKLTGPADQQARQQVLVVAQALTVRASLGIAFTD